MWDNHLSRLFYFLFFISLLMLSLIEGKGFSSGRGGGGFKGGSKGSGSFSGSSSYNRANSYGSNMGKPRTRGTFRKTAMSFAAGAAGGVAAYAVMRSMSGSYHSRPSGYYGENYGVGETCVNNENLNGTVFGKFRCPLYGFPEEARDCCGEYGKQYCCLRERQSRFFNQKAHFGWIVLAILILLIVILCWARRHRNQQKGDIMIPAEPPMHEQNGPPPFYHPPPPPMGYPPPPGVNLYAVPPQNEQGNFNPYAQQYQTPHPQQPYTPYPPQQHQYNPY